MNRSFTILLVVLMGGILVSAGPARELRPGLLATAGDGEREVAFVMATPNFTLNERQSIHSQLQPGFKTEWTGFLNILRAGEYTIRAPARVFIDGREVQNQAVQLEAGERPVRILFQREPGSAARLQLQWESEFFDLEPVPARVLSHADAPAVLRLDELRKRGRLLVEELNCAACHHDSSQLLQGRAAPDLSAIGSRTTADWMFHWLENPRHLRADAVMPAMVFNPRERADVAAYLATLREDRTELPEIVATPEHLSRGRELFNSIGCATCHAGDSLAGAGSKYQAPSLAKFLMDPLAVNPGGRMPHMFLTWDEAEALAAYLVQSRKPEFERPAPPGNIARGRELVSTLGCVNCHAVSERGRKLETQLTAAPFHELLRQPQDRLQERPLPLSTESAEWGEGSLADGCLAAVPSGRAPRFSLTEFDRESLRTFLQSPDRFEAPVLDFHRRITQFNCAACHEIDGPARSTFAFNETPPSLSDAGNQFRASWLADVLLNQERIRPWMNLRMPHHGDSVAELVDLFAAQAGAELGDGKRAPSPTPLQLKEGSRLIGREGLSCINCHDFAGYKTVGDLRGPDLVNTDARIRTDWLHRWLLDPGRIRPGTAMPAFFSDMPRDQADAMIEAMVRALAAPDQMPPPAGLVEAAQGYTLVPQHETIILRAFAPNSSHRSIAVGLPQGHSYVFDALEARFRYAWAGGFIDAGPAWAGRGGGPVTILGEKYYTAPDFFPLRLGDPEREPTVKFLGYELMEDNTPQFIYEVDGIVVKELITSTPDGSELVRAFELGPVTSDVWFLAGPGPGVRSPAGEFDQGRLRIPGGEIVRFEIYVEPPDRLNAN